MEKRRKDDKGRVLKEGEYQRKDGTYCFRYYDQYKVRKSVYAKTLSLLREKEEKIKQDITDKIDTYGAQITVCELVDRYLSLKKNLKPRTIINYTTVKNLIENDPFGRKKVNSIRISDAKAWYIKLHESGYKRGTITVFGAVVKPAFEMAVNDDLIRKNPFKFSVASLLPDDADKRIALTQEQQDFYLDFVKKDGKHYNEVVILLETGMRIGELYGLTLSDIDMKNKRVTVNKQLVYDKIGSKYVVRVTSPKSSSGIRTIPMTQAAYDAFHDLIKTRKKAKVENMVDGYSGFLLVSRNGNPQTKTLLQIYMKKIQPEVEKNYKGCFPKTTPHVLRHTFCTNTLQKGLDIKSLQYIMGHSNVDITLNTYSHTNYEQVEKHFLAL